MSWIRASIAWLSVFLIACTSGGQTVGNADTPSLYRGSVNCIDCHRPRENDDRVKEVKGRVQFNEGVIWQQEDFHSKAYRNLKSPWGQRIGELMGVNVLDPEARCVQCHGIHADHSQLSPIVAFGTTGQGDDVLALARKGVTCEACHGASSEWFDEHQQFDVWSKQKAAYRTGKGWIDVRSPVERAEVCLSCHVGNFDQDRVITHEMYAAGHPPLTGFEIESFVNRMPRHWHYPYEKDPIKTSFDRTQNILIGSIVALRMSVELAMKDAQLDNELDFARLDCYACHHDLSDSQWRQVREAHGIPGRPPLAVGSIPIVEVAARVVKGPAAAEQMDGLVNQLRTPFAEATFGASDQLARLGPMVVAGCKKLEDRLNRSLTADEARQVLSDLAEFGASEPVDFDTARQLMGAWLVVYQELVDHGALKLNSAAQAQITKLLGAIDESDFFVLDKEKGRAKKGEPDYESIKQRVEILFQDRLNYNPEKFAAVMKRLDELTRPQSAKATP